MPPDPPTSDLPAAPPESSRSWLAVLRSDVLEAIRGSRRDFTKEPLTKALFLLAVPMILEMSMHSVFAIFDTYFVGRLGPAAVASVGLSESLLSVIFAVALGLGMGVAAMVARRMGEKDPEAAAVVTVQAIGLGVFLALTIGLTGALNAERLLRLMGARDDILETGTGYAMFAFGSSGIILLMFVINAAFRGAGDPSLALRVLAVANAVNIVLDPLLIFGLGPIPALGVTGAAVATTLGRSIGLAYQIRILTRGDGRLRIRRRHLEIVPKVMLRMLRVSGMGILQFFLATSSFTGMVRVITPYSSEALAGYTIAVRVIMFVLLPAWGLGNAAATLVGQNLGAHKPDRAEHAVWVSVRFNLVLFGLTALLFFFFSQPLVGLFTDSAEAVLYGSQCLRMVSYGYLMTAFGLVLMAAFNGAGDTTTPMWINLWAHWIVKIPLAWALAWPLGWGPLGVFVAIPVAEVIVAVTAIVVFRRGRWKSHVV